MAQNPIASAQISLETFGGYVSFADPVSLPPGASPACSDMSFQPGGTSSRPCFQKVFATAFGSVSVNYAKSYVDPTGAIRNLYLDSSGNLWIENISAPFTISAATNANPAVLTATGNTIPTGASILLAGGTGNWTAANGKFIATVVSPGSTFSIPVNSTAFGALAGSLQVVAFVITQTTPGAYAKSITAFGREYIAINDGLHGQEVPLQYDGTNLDRVTSDGPGTSPTVGNLTLPPIGMAVVPSSGPTITSITTTDLNPVGNFFTTVTVVLTAPPAVDLAPGQLVTVSGNSEASFNIFYGGILDVIDSSTFRMTFYYTPPVPGVALVGTGGAVSGIGSATITRANNIVTVSMVANNWMQPGFRAQISGVDPASIGGGIASIVINNESLPGLATVNTVSRHGLTPGLRVSLTGILATSLGSISSIKRAGGIVTVILSASASVGMVPGSSVTIAGVTTASFNCVATVSNVKSTTYQGDTFTYFQTDADATDTTGTVSLNWRIPATETPTYFTVVATPGGTSFQVPIDYPDGTWGANGTVTYAWDGTFYVISVSPPTGTEIRSVTTLAAAIVTTGATSISVTSGTGIANNTTIQINNEQMLVAAGGGTGTLTVIRGVNGTTAATHLNGATVSLVSYQITYQQYGPDDSSTSFGVVTPSGQMAPGKHQMQVFFINRQGGVTAPSPPVTFIANGGQYPNVTNIPIGPPTTVARAIAFTGAEGAYFFYIPNPPQVNGQLVGTATQINDNTTTNALFDFGDPTLFAATGISVQGNNLANQITIEGSLGFGFYSSRLITWGQRNIVDNLLNMGFGGGYMPDTGTAIPTGWELGGTPGTLIDGHFETVYEINTIAGFGASGVIRQGAYQDYSGAPIVRPSTQYRFRAWLKPTVAWTDLHFVAEIFDADTGFSSKATITGSQMSTSGGWAEAEFTLPMPTVIPQGMTFTVYALSTVHNSTVQVNDMSVIYSAAPYTTGCIGSYVNNPEGFDGVSGPFGPANDTHPVMVLGIIRDNLYMLTQDPSGRLHETSQGITEPAEWTVNEVAANCGTISAYSFTQSQADDSSAAGGEEFFAWYSSTGIRIFGGQEPDKISQEIQRPPGVVFPGSPSDLGALNPAAQLTAWALNDPDQKIMYFGIPEVRSGYVAIFNSGGSGYAQWAVGDFLSTGMTGTIITIGGISYTVQAVITPLLIRLTTTVPGISIVAYTWAASSPSVIYTLTYTGLDSASAIAANPAIRKTVTGKLAANDLVRKWCPWQLPVNGAALMFREAGALTPVFFAGIKSGNVYILNPNYFTDDDFGQVYPYYTTYGMPDRDTEKQEKLGGGMKMVSYTQSLINGIGYQQFAIFCNTLATVINAGVQWSPRICGATDYLMQANPTANMEWAGGQATAQRFFIRFASTPDAAGSTASPSTDNAFGVSVIGVALRENAKYKVRGRYP